MKTFLEIIRGMERAFFMTAWADAHAGLSFPPGASIEGLTPAETDPAAVDAARTLHAAIVRANHNRGLDQLWKAHPAGYTPEQWGHCAAMQAMGRGVGLSDNEECPVVVPAVEFTFLDLQRKYF